MRKLLNQLPVVIAAVAFAVTLGVVLYIQLRPPASSGPAEFTRTRLKPPQEATAAPAPPARSEPPPENPSQGRWAVVPSVAMSKSRLTELLTVALLEKSHVQLVERAEVDAILREQSVSNLLGSDSVEGRLKLGRLLRADVLVLLGKQEKDDKPFVRVAISDTSYGARLGLEFLPYTEAKVGGLIEPIVAFVDETRSRYPDGVQAIVAVPPFVCRNLIHRYDHFQRQLSHVLQAGLAAHPGTAVLEIEQARAIQREEALTGHSDEARVIPVFVEGEYRVTEAGEAKGAVKLTLRVTSGDQQQSIEEDLPGTAEAVRWLEMQMPAQVLRIPESDAKATLSADRQIALLCRRADAFYRLDELVESSALREAALLIDPNNAEQARQLFHEYMLLVPFEKHYTYYVLTDEEFVQTWRNRLWAWRRGLGLLELLIRNKLIARRNALSLVMELNATINSFVGCSPKTGESCAPGPEAMNVLRKELARCTQVHRAFVRDTLPLTMDLHFRQGMREPVTARISTLRRCLELCMQRPYHGIDRPPSTGYDWDHLGRLLTMHVPDLPVVSDWIMGLLIREAAFSGKHEADPRYLNLLRTLESSESQIVHAYGRLGSILCAHYFGRDGKKTSRSEMLTQLDDWESALNAQLYRGYGADDIASCLKRIRKDQTPVAAPRRRRRRGERPEPPRTLSFDEVRLRVRRKSGALMAWAGSEALGIEGWIPRGGTPERLVQTDNFDLFFNRWTVLIHEERGILRALFTLGGNHRIKDVKYDGAHIWVLTCCQGVYVLSPSGEQLAHGGARAGLPPSNQAGFLLARGVGKVVATGSFGKDKRAWCANLTLQDGQVQVDVFHEATISRTDQGDVLDSTKIAFVPTALYWIPDPQEEKGGMVLVIGRYPRWRLYPEQRRVECVVGYPIDAPRSNDDRHEYCFLENGDRFDAHKQTFRAWIHPSKLKAGEESLRTLYAFKDKGYKFYGAAFAYDGYVYAPGREWLRADPETLEVEHFGTGKLGSMSNVRLPCHHRSHGSPRAYFGVSRHFGLVGWDNLGHFYRITVGPPHPASLHAGSERTQTSGQANDPLRALRPLVEAIHRFRNERYLWPAELNELVPDFLPAIAHDAVAYETALDGPTVLRETLPRAESGMWRQQAHLAYVFGGTDQGWYQFEYGRGEPMDVEDTPPDRPARSEDERIRRITAEFERRIAANPSQELIHQCQTSYLFVRNRIKEAKAAAVAWVEAFPKSMDARYALLDIERKVRSGLDPYETNREWSRGPYATFATWRLFHNPVSAGKAQRGLPEAIRLPVASGKVENYIGEIALYEAASLYVHYGKNKTLEEMPEYCTKKLKKSIEYCDQWEKIIRQRNDPHDASHLTLRAYARFRLGQYEQAEMDSVAAVKHLGTGSSWAGDAGALLRAIRARDRAFKLHYELPQYHIGTWIKEPR